MKTEGGVVPDARGAQDAGQTRSSVRRESYAGLILSHPLKLLWAIYDTLALLAISLLHRLLLPGACHATSFRVQILRCFLGGFLARFWDLMFKAPPEMPCLTRGSHKRYAEIILGGRVPAVVVPPSPVRRGGGEAKVGGEGAMLPVGNDERDTVFLLYAHGGGFLFGEPLMHLGTYERWVRKAAAMKWRLVVVAVEYRLSTQAKWPACRDDFLTAYGSLLTEQRIDPQCIVFGGDSAGGGLAAMSALHARRTGMPAPRGLLLLSPWVDLNMSKTLNSPAMATDFLVTFQKDNPTLVAQFLPPGIEPTSPLVSPVFDDLSGLPPQLVLAGTAEVLLPDSEEWVRRSKQSGNAVEFVCEQGQLHMQVPSFTCISCLLFDR